MSYYFLQKHPKLNVLTVEVYPDSPPNPLDFLKVDNPVEDYEKALKKWKLTASKLYTFRDQEQEDLVLEEILGKHFEIDGDKPSHFHPMEVEKFLLKGIEVDFVQIFDHFDGNVRKYRAYYKGDKLTSKAKTLKDTIKKLLFDTAKKTELSEGFNIIISFDNQAEALVKLFSEMKYVPVVNSDIGTEKGVKLVSWDDIYELARHDNDYMFTTQFDGAMNIINLLKNKGYKIFK